MTVINNHLALKCQDFWLMSLAWRKRPTPKNYNITVGDAITGLNKILEGTGEYRRLYQRALYLQHYIICGKELTDEEKGKDKA